MPRQRSPRPDALAEWSRLTVACLELMRAAARAEAPDRDPEVAVRARLARQRRRTLRAYLDHA